jgi:hypothetical protein
MSTVITPSFALTLGNLRSLVVPSYTTEGLPATVGANPRGAMFVHQDLPERSELARLGTCYIGRSAARVSVTAIPTTSGGVGFWNGELPGGKAYVIDSIAATATVDNTADTMLSLVCMVSSSTSATAPGSAGAGVVNSTTGRTYAGKATFSITITGLTDQWFTLGSSSNTAATGHSVGLQVEAYIGGAIILAPQYFLALNSIAQSATNQVKFVIKWYEVAIPVVTI